jgi:hypothetical protein
VGIAGTADDDVFLPKFLDHTARLDKNYPNVEAFLQDNELAIRDFETIVTSACRFLNIFSHTIEFEKYFKLLEDQRAISLS